MDAQLLDGGSPIARVKVTINLGSEMHYAQANKGSISEQLISVKEVSMGILKEFITKHNIPNDVPDDPEEVSSEDDSDTPVKPPLKKAKTPQ